jgi:hypothetical protein
LSTTDPANLEEAVGTVVQYIWNNIQCDSIRIEAYQIKDDSGAYKPDPLIKQVYAAHKFRWATLKNDPTTGKRAEVK